MSAGSSDQEPAPAPAEQKYWLDSPANVDKLVRRFYAACAFLLLIDVAVPKHGPFAIEHLWGFYGIFGFVACVALVLIAKEVLRRVVMRPEDYYDR